MSDNLFTIRSTSVVTSFRCNLNCKHCAAYAPYLKNKLERSNDEIMKGVERFYNIVDKVEWFTILGGEPLIYKDLPDLLERLLAYKDRFEKVQIITNGTIVPSDELINVIKKYGEKFYSFFIDDYGPDLSKKIPEIEEVLKKYDVPYFVRDYHTEDMHCGGWIDLGDMRHEQHTWEEAQNVFDKCGIRKVGLCSMIADTIWYPCDQVFRRLDLGQKVASSDYIDFTDESLTVEQQREKFRKIYDDKCLETCKYCAGYCEDSVRVRPALQLTPEELKEINESNKS